MLDYLCILMSDFNIDTIRADFPILSTFMANKPLVYLDNAATTQKPIAVIDKVRNHYALENANIHRGVYRLSEQATIAYDNARSIIASYLGVSDSAQLVFTKGATEGVNLVAYSWGRVHLKAGDEILLTQMEHHANIVPWQIVAEERGAVIKVIPVLKNGELDLSNLDTLVTEKTKVVGAVYASNALGTINPIDIIIKKAKEQGALTVIDGTQAIGHFKVNLEDLDCDFFVCSAHKAFGPTGVGCVYGKISHWETMVPYQTGGDMIERVSFEKTTFAPMPARYEAGTPNISGVIGFGAAIKYLNQIGLKAIEAYEADLLAYLTESLKAIDELRIVGTSAHKVPLASFLLDDIHPHDVASTLAAQGVAVRAGHHCAQPLMKRLGIVGTNRASLAFYNNKADVDALVDAIKKTIQFFK